MVGRFLFGFSSGVFLCATPKVIEETIPTHLQDYGFSTSTNMMINVFIAITMFMGVGMPEENEELKTTYYWKFIYLSPIPILVFVLILTFFVFKNDSVNFHVERG